LELKLSELAALVGGQFAFRLSPEPLIRGAVAIAEAGEGDVTFFSNPKYLPALKACSATAVLVPVGFAEEITPIAIQVENPSIAFAQLLEKFAPEPVTFTPGVHPTAFVGDRVEIGEGASIQPHAVIEAGARIGAGTIIGAGSYIGHDAQIGAGCRLAAHVSIGASCTLGERVILHSGVVVGSDGFGFEFAEGRHLKIPQIGIVQIDSDVEIGANTTIDRARFGRTWIGEGTKIDNLVQIAHNVVIGKHCIVCAQVGISGSTVIGDYVTIAGQAAFVGHIRVGDRATIGARSGVSKDIPAGEVVWGTPAMPMREAKEQLAHTRRLGKLYERVRDLERAAAQAGKVAPSSSEAL
jgi:UDP-3-O-[3-hydroxymyristoyl] glucosamine N-acyltransferase